MTPRNVMPRVRSLSCQRQRGLTRLDPAASLPDIEVDQHANARATLARRA